MALIPCPECSAKISDQAVACPHCGLPAGTKVTKARGEARPVVVAIALVVGGVWLLSSLTGKPKSADNATKAGATAPSLVTAAPSAPPKSPEELAKAAEERATLAAQRREQQAILDGLRWRYHVEPDKMGRGTIKSAYIASVNQVTFEFPYGGPQRATLTLRQHPKYGRDVILTVEKGQFKCGYDDCYVGVKFDEGKAKIYSAVEPSDNSTDTLFIQGYKGFEAAAQKSKKIYIEATFYKEGARVFEFESAGLNW